MTRVARFNRLVPVLAAAALCALLTACAGGAGGPAANHLRAQEAFQRSTEIQRKSQPLSEWIRLRPEELSLVTRQRLVSDKAALLIGRFMNTGGTDTPPASQFVTSVSTIADSKSIMLSSETDGKPDGWGAVLVKPGRYGHLQMRMTIKTRFTGGRTVNTVIPDGTAEEVLRLREKTRTINVRAGEIIYIGTRKWSPKKGTGPARYRVLNQAKAARSWLRRYAPALASSMVVRPLPPSVKQRQLSGATGSGGAAKKPQNRPPPPTAPRRDLRI